MKGSRNLRIFTEFLSDLIEEEELWLQTWPIEDQEDLRRVFINILYHAEHVLNQW